MIGSPNKTEEDNSDERLVRRLGPIDWRVVAFSGAAWSERPLADHWLGCSGALGLGLLSAAAPPCRLSEVRGPLVRQRRIPAPDAGALGRSAGRQASDEPRGASG